MAKKEKIVLTVAQRSLGHLMDNKASEYAGIVAPMVQGDVDRLIAAKQEWEGGKFTVMFRLTSGMTKEQLDALPDPNAKDGNNPAHYYSSVISDGKEKVREHYFYEEMVLGFPAIKAKGLRIDQLNRSMGDAAKVNQSDIGADIRNMTIDYRKAEINRLQGEITGAIGSVTGAFELFHQFRRFEELKHCEAFPLYKIGPDGLPLDGEDGRERVIENTRTPIVVQTTIKARQSIDVSRVGVGTFLKYDVDKAKENHGTYQAVIDTAKREKKTDETENKSDATPQLIRTADTALARLTDIYEFADFAWDEKDGKLLDAMKKATSGAGSDDAFVTVMALKRFLNDVCPDSPRNAQRYQELIGKEESDAA